MWGKAKTYPLTPELIEKARLLELAGDPTRIRILCFMFEHEKACVSEISDALEMSIGSISHHLQIMRDNDYFITERMGNMICYILVQNKFIKQLKKLICE
ncbi:MAG: winged helix-turn-helix transcriptional regulator [Candidatus Magasanikbacteria bacterium]|nr:winged helix-turn-helix transcriptional regulator [Candidatus Magasanikbacteria bacterium]